MTDSFHIATGSTKGSHKQRNGDAHTFLRFGPGQAYLGAMLADGVGSTSTDWLASSTACEHFKEIGEGLTTSIEDPEQWLTHTTKELDEALEHAPQLLLCAASVIVWEIGSDTLHFANVGDTRLHKVWTESPKQISTDESKAVIRRGSDGKPLYSGGSVVIQRGITQALGSGSVTPKVESCTFAPGETLILSSDGFYGDQERFLNFATQVASTIDLGGTVDEAINEYEGGNDDDATVLVVRREFGSLSNDTIECALSGTPDERTCPPHALFSCIEARLEHWIEQKDETNFLRDLDYLSNQSCLIPQNRIEALTQQMLNSGWNSQRQHAPLQTMLRRHYYKNL